MHRRVNPKSVLFIATLCLTFSRWALAEPAADGEEVEVNLDDLDLAEDSAKKKAPAEGEVEIDLDALGGGEGGEEEVAYLPVNTDLPEATPSPLYVVFILGILVPVGAMLVTPKRKRSTKNASKS
jgi:hypothetical protein